MRRLCVVILQFIFISVCFCDFTDNKDKFINAFVNHLNNLPDQALVYDEADLIKLQQNKENEYYIEIKVKASDQNSYSTKYQNCTGNLSDGGDGQISVIGAECSDFVESWTENMEELVTDITTNDGPIQLENEVQSENTSTSGEQFIAVPRDRPLPCIGCASFVDANAKGVKELAGLGIRQLDRHEPNMRHSLNNVVSVERQVQVVGGVRYIMTLAVDYDNCTSNETESCNFQKTCKVTILEKPWQRLTDGSKFRAILSNNCTDEWLFDENDLNNQNNNIINPAVDNYDNSHLTTPEYDQTEASEDSVKAVHKSEAQAQPNAAKPLTDDQMRELEEQIIPVSSLNRPEHINYNVPSESHQDARLTEEKANKLGDAKPSEEFTSTQTPDTSTINSGLPQDKKKAIDELMIFFDFSGLKDKLNNEDLIRMKRDYGSELQILNLAESYQDMKTKIKNAKFIHKLAQAMVDHLNEIDIEVKNRVLLEVVSAEEEFEKDLRYFYVQARVTVPCDKRQCKDRVVKMCNGIIDATGDQPSVLYTVCSNDRKKSLGKLKDVREDDPILLKFVRRAMRKIDLESKVPYALRIRKILSASMQKVSGILTKISVEIEYTECFKTVPLFRRNNCSALENLGFRLCDIEVLERHWLKETKLTYVCTERPVDEIFVGDTKNNLNTTTRLSVDDPQVLEILQEALLYLETKSNRNNKQKIVEVKSVPTQQVAGMLTNIAFIVGYTICTSEYKDDVNTCQLLDNEPLRNCSVEIWERPWLVDERQLNVTCEIIKTKKNQLLKREERDTHALVGSPLEKEVDDPQYKSLAEKSLQKHLKESTNTQHYKLIKIDKVTLQIVSGTLTTIDFHISPTNCQVNSDGEPTSTDCVVENLDNTVACQSKIWERPWVKSGSQNIEVNCNSDIEKSRTKRSIQTTENEIEQNPNEYKNLTDDCLTNYMAVYEIEKHYKVIKINRVVKVNTTGDLTKIYFVAGPTNCSVNNGYPTSSPCEINDIKNTLSCHADVWIKTSLNGRIINVNCQNDEAKVRRKRHVLGGLETQDTNNPKYKTLAEKSLRKYILRSRITQYHDVVLIEHVSEQIVSGKKTKISFMASPTNCQINKNGRPTSDMCKVKKEDKILRCDAEIFEQSWLGKEDITVNCHPYKSREKRDLPGGEKEQETSDPKYMQLAQESLAQYVTSTGTTKQHTILRITQVTTQVVAGKLTHVDFDVQSQDQVLKCHSKIFEQTWLNKKEIEVNCEPSKSRRRREIQLASAVRSMGRFQHNMNNRLKSGGYHEQDPTEPKYTQMVEEALRKYQHRKRSKFLHKVIEVKRASSQVVSGKKYKIDFTAALTTCASNVTNVDLCDVANSSTLYCHAEIWDKSWLKRRDIDVFCNTDNTDEENDSYSEDEETSREKRSLSNNNEKINVDLNDKPNKLLPPVSHLNQIHIKSKTDSPNIVSNKTTSDNYFRKNKIYNTKRYLQLAEDSLREFESLSKAEVLYKVVKIHYVNEDEDMGIRRRLEFTASPSNCSSTEHMIKDNCQFVEPKELVSCHADIRFTLMLEANFARNIEVKCKKQQKKNVNETELFKTRHKRQLPIEEYVEDDLTYLYADNAVSRLNTLDGEQNLYKLVTVHDVRRTVHMKVPVVRMYIEVARTLCLRDDVSHDLASCNELDGLMHELCYARIWPSSYDDLVLKKIDVVCEIDLGKFITLTGFNTHTLLEATMIVLNSKGKYPNFHRVLPGPPPYLIPTLDYNEPFKLSFIVIGTNCTTEHAMALDRQRKLFDDICLPNYGEIPKRCNAQIYMTSNSRDISFVNVSCFATLKRNKRSIPIRSDNVTDEDVTIQKLIQESLEQLEMVSIHNYKQRVLVINRYSTKYTTRKETTIDFDVGYTNCLKYEWVDNITSCEFLEHLPRRHCVSVVWEKLWVENGRQIHVDCTDDETPLEANMEYETAQSAMALSNEALKHIEYKYPHPRRQKVVRIFSLEKQMVAGIHYRIKMEVGYTKCMALSVEDNCELDPQIEARRFCRANVWMRTWTNHPPSYRVSCDYQDGNTNEIYHELQTDHLFSYFLETYKPSYLNDHEEIRHRYNIFKENIKKIHELNLYEMGTARYAVTRSADMSAEEFRSKFLGLDLKLRDENLVPMPAAEIPSVSIPDAFDWREHDAVTEVKDQGMCGSCWAFSVTGNIEGQWKMHSGKLVSLSEQELVDCDKLDQGCNGGLPDNAYRAIEQLGGLETESDYPYEAEDDKCAYNASLSRVQISGAVNISSNETDMAKWLVKNGPISIGINANAMQFYVGGVSHPWRMLCNPSNLDHGVLIVGLGEKDYPLFHKKLPYWTVKNSWGKSWGEQGYYRVFRGDGTCGVNMMASSAVV